MDKIAIAILISAIAGFVLGLIFDSPAHKALKDVEDEVLAFENDIKSATTADISKVRAFISRIKSAL